MKRDKTTGEVVPIIATRILTLRGMKVILDSERAVAMSVFVVRAFLKMRQTLVGLSVWAIYGKERFRPRRSRREVVALLAAPSSVAPELAAATIEAAKGGISAPPTTLGSSRPSGS